MRAKFLSYSEKFKVMDKEALATLICALLITLFFWGVIFLCADLELFMFGLPLWFILSCLGGYLLSILGVMFILKRYFVNFDLEQDAPEEEDAN